MSHVDEGLLNALLDDELTQREASRVSEHLATCEICQNRLAETRRCRERAESILQTADPGVEIPPFQQVVERAGAADARRKASSLSRFRSLAWAATLVVAVAVGWYARGQLTVQESTGALVVTADTSTAVPGEREEPEQPARIDQDRSGAPVESRLEQRRTIQEPHTPAPTETTTDPGPEITVRTPAPTAVRIAVDPRQRADSIAFLAAAAQEPEIDEISIATPLADSELAVRGTVGDWIRTDRASAQSFIGSRLFAVSDLPVLSYEIRTSGDRRRLTRTAQRLPAGGQLYVFQERDGVAEKAERRRPVGEANALGPRGGATALTETRGEFLVTLQAQLTADSLRALFRRVN